MPTIFKLLHQRHVDGTMSGESVRLGTLAEYRNREKRNRENKGIGDRDEGAAIDIVKSFTFNTATDLDNAEKLAQLRDMRPFENVKFTEEALKERNFQINMSNNKFIREINHYLFCASRTIDNDVVERMKRDSEIDGDDAYDFVIPIVRPDQFAAAIGVPIGKRFNKEMVNLYQVMHLNVKYDAKENDLIKNGQSDPNPFIKGTDFLDQKEYRFVIPVHLDEDQEGECFKVDFLDDPFGEPFPLCDFEKHIGKYQD